MVAAAFFLIFAVVTFRLVTGFSGFGGDFANFSPVAALVLCGAAFLPKRFAIAVPLAAMLITDVALNLHGGYPLFTAGMLLRYFAFGLILAIGFQLRSKKSRGAYQWKLFGGALAGTILFYLVSNTGAWISLPGYAKTFAGWWQAQTVGLPLPGFPPTYIFLRNSLAGDLFFTGLFATCFALAARTSQAPANADLDGVHATH